MRTKTEDSTLKNVTMVVQLKDGIGKVPFPHDLKQGLFNAYCICHAVKTTAGLNKTLVIQCDASYYQEHNQNLKHNVLQVFESKRALEHFPVKIVNTFNTTPDTLQFFVKEWSSTTKKYELATAWSGLIIIEIYGFAIV